MREAVGASLTAFNLTAPAFYRARQRRQSARRLPLRGCGCRLLCQIVPPMGAILDGAADGRGDLLSLDAGF